MKENFKIMVAAGGTGGHLFPAIAVVQKLEKYVKKIEVKFFGTANRIESKIVPQSGYELITMPITGYSGIFSLNSWLLPYKIWKSIKICRKEIKKFKPQAILCTGAYISYPAGVAATKEKIPLVLMESNVNPGKTIKALSKKATFIITSFAETEKYLEGIEKDRIKFFGNPVRENMLQSLDKEQARKQFGLSPEKETVLIFGGSLGALTINKATEKVIEHFKDKDIQFIWQTGDLYKTEKTNNEKLKIVPFIDNMAMAYSASDLVVCRSGATTVAELSVCGKASVLIPLPSASNQEQLRNAEVFAKKGAAVLLNNSEAEEKLYKVLEDLICDTEKIKSMETEAMKLAKLDAAEKTAELILSL
ncbi:undecaprenyldiphospho-muramoylpentapeptide beta-N-acetylglucosaminyltransferase [Bacteroidetes/Chlorobi group bacterium ChocPot_Mid]|nr:MAG: undecaprenyldiphospho-muramoylpentapeptide beta-N-acetylglucosaminyltransferase [Bacteroidetes/Chlorobi group bacterium ChocPot_Mid]